MSCSRKRRADGTRLCPVYDKLQGCHETENNNSICYTNGTGQVSQFVRNTPVQTEDIYSIITRFPPPQPPCMFTAIDRDHHAKFTARDHCVREVASPRRCASTPPFDNEGELYRQRLSLKVAALATYIQDNPIIMAHQGQWPADLMEQVTGVLCDRMEKNPLRLDLLINPEMLKANIDSVLIQIIHDSRSRHEHKMQESLVI